MNLTSILSSTCLLIVSAYATFTIPITETGIPFTMQSLVLFILAGILSPKEIFSVVTFYLLLGMLGLPVFADGSSGLDKILGASGGFLYGFLFSGLSISYMLTKVDRNLLLNLTLVFLLATLVLFLFGLAHLAIKFDLNRSLEYGLYPFWKVAIAKAIIAALLIYFYEKAVSKANV